jgi:hypothetical protein
MPTRTRHPFRTASIKKVVTTGGTEGLVFLESWWPSPPSEELPRIVDVAVKQRDAWRAEAENIRVRLESTH